MPLRFDELKADTGQKPSSNREVARSSEGWYMLRARVSNESDMFIAYSSGG